RPFFTRAGGVHLDDPEREKALVVELLHPRIVRRAVAARADAREIEERHALRDAGLGALSVRVFDVPDLAVVAGDLVVGTGLRHLRLRARDAPRVRRAEGSARRLQRGDVHLHVHFLAVDHDGHLLRAGLEDYVRLLAVRAGGVEAELVPLGEEGEVLRG